MKISASDINNENFEVEVLLSEKEHELETGLISFSIGISRIIEEFTHQFAKSEEQATALANVIHDMVKDIINEYIDSGIFTEVAAACEEHQLYAYMKEIFEGWLEDKQKDQVELTEKFRDVDTMKFDVAIDGEHVTISLTNGDGSVREVLNTFPQALGQHSELLERSVSINYIIATVLSDLIFGDGEDNPIRKLCHTPGYADGGLMGMVKHLLASYA